MADLQFTSLKEDLALDGSALSNDAVAAINILQRYAEELRNSVVILNKEVSYLHKESSQLRREKIALEDLIETSKKQGVLFR